MSAQGQMPMPIPYKGQAFPAFRWNQIVAYSQANVGVPTMFTQSDIWTHQALVKADVGNTDSITFGPTSSADGSTLVAGTEYLIPTIMGNLNGQWPRFNLKDWFFKSNTAAQKIILWYV